MPTSCTEKSGPCGWRISATIPSKKIEAPPIRPPLTKSIFEDVKFAIASNPPKEGLS
jgi:hypothetical protein